MYLLGFPEFRIRDQVLSFPTRKAAALLCYLAVEGGQQPRDHLATLLWPESSPQRSYASLRNTLGHLQNTFHALQPSNIFLAISHKTLGLNPEADIFIDLRMVESAYVAARQERSRREVVEDAVSLPLLHAAMKCYRGDFLTGFSLTDSPMFDDWVAIQQEIWRRRLGMILDRLSEVQFAEGDFASTSETASQWITLEPLNEGAYRRKMRAHFAAGQRGQALETYEACRAVLAAELNLQPESDTEELAIQIRTQQTPTHLLSQIVSTDTPAIFLESLFAGRDVEMKQLEEDYQQTLADGAHLVLVTGEAGIGKTRLVHQFLAKAEGLGAQVLQGRAFESGTHLSYQPLIEALRPLIDRSLVSDSHAWLSALRLLLPELRRQQSDLDIDRTELFESLVNLTLTLAKNSPLILFLDDM